MADVLVPDAAWIVEGWDSINLDNWYRCVLLLAQRHDWHDRGAGDVHVTLRSAAVMQWALESIAWSGHGAEGFRPDGMARRFPSAVVTAAGAQH